MIDIAGKRVKWVVAMHDAIAFKTHLNGHKKADGILQEIVREAGFPEIVELYQNVERHYSKAEK